MPKGKHKGGRRCFTNFDEQEAQKLKEEKEKAWRKARGEEDSEGEGEGEAKKKEESSGESESSEEESSEEEEEEEVKPKPKGTAGLIEIENPNHAIPKMKKVSALTSNVGTTTTSAKPQLSRKEREEVERQRAAANYRKLHEQGKTEEARADLERLALIRKQREEAQKKKVDEKKAKEAAAASKRDKVAKALNKKDDR